MEGLPFLLSDKYFIIPSVSYFDIIKKDPSSFARVGTIHTTHGDIQTPAFLPIGTKGAVKSVTSEELKFWGADIILANNLQSRGFA